jgi:hypothetical protein
MREICSGGFQVVHSKITPLRIFISHASEDQPIADVIRQTVTTAFLDEIDISLISQFSSGANWRKSLLEIISKTDVLIAVEVGSLRPAHSFTGAELGAFAQSVFSQPTMTAHPHLERRLIPVAVLPVDSSMAREFEGIDIDPADIHVVSYDYSAKFGDKGAQSNFKRPQSKSLNLLFEIDRILDARTTDGSTTSTSQRERIDQLNELSLRMTEAIVSLALLRRSRELSAWDDLIRLADDAPQNVAQSTEVRHLLVR